MNGMTSQDRAEVLRGKARTLTYDEIQSAIRRAAELDDGDSQHSGDGYSWAPDGYGDPQARINEVGSSLGRVLFAKGGCTRAAFEAFLPALNEQLGAKLRLQAVA